MTKEKNVEFEKRKTFSKKCYTVKKSYMRRSVIFFGFFLWVIIIASFITADSPKAASGYTAQLQAVETYISDAETLDSAHPLPKKHVETLRSVLNQPAFSATQHAVGLAAEAGSALTADVAALSVKRLGELWAVGKISQEQMLQNLEGILHFDAVYMLFSLLEDKRIDKALALNAFSQMDIENIYPEPEPFPNVFLKALVGYTKSQDKEISEAALSALTSIPKLPDTAAVREIIQTCARSKKETASDCLEVQETWNSPPEDPVSMADEDIKNIINQFSKSTCILPLNVIEKAACSDLTHNQKSTQVSKTELDDLRQCIKAVPIMCKGNESQTTPEMLARKYGILFSAKKPECVRARQSIHKQLVDDILTKKTEPFPGIPMLPCYRHDELAPVFVRLLQSEDQEILQHAIFALYSNPDIAKDANLRDALRALRKKITDLELRSLVSILLSPAP